MLSLTLALCGRPSKHAKKDSAQASTDPINPPGTKLISLLSDGTVLFI